MNFPHDVQGRGRSGQLEPQGVDPRGRLDVAAGEIEPELEVAARPGRHHRGAAGALSLLGIRRRPGAPVDQIRTDRTALPGGQGLVLFQGEFQAVPLPGRQAIEGVEGNLPRAGVQVDTPGPGPGSPGHFKAPLQLAGVDKGRSVPPAAGDHFQIGKAGDAILSLRPPQTAPVCRGADVVDIRQVGRLRHEAGPVDLDLVDLEPDRRQGGQADVAHELQGHLEIDHRLGVVGLALEGTENRAPTDLGRLAAVVEGDFVAADEVGLERIIG